MAKVAVVQESPIFLDRQRTLGKAVELLDEAAHVGAELVVFPEAFIPGYPAWIWRARPGGDWSLNEALHARLLDNAVDVGAGDLAPLCEAARERQVTVVCGLHERDHFFSHATLYNSVVVIGPDGFLLNRHRKLMPTNPERMVWGMGDATGLNTVDTPAGRIGTLICWENYMPLARYTLYAQGVQIHVAPTYDSGPAWTGTLQHIAREGRCYVIGCGVPIENADIPADFPERESFYPQGEDWINPGDSVVIAPGGEIIAGPMHEEKGLLIAQVEADRASTAKRALDVAGHYSRSDIFTLQVNRKPQVPISYE